jgi:hypothetical protein
VVYVFPIARLASLAIITPAVVVYPAAVATVAAGMPPVTVIVLYPPFCAGCTVCVIAGVLARMSVGVIVMPTP